MATEKNNPTGENDLSIALLVQRQLDVVSTGNGAYLEMFLKTLREAQASVTLIFAPWRSFGNRPWAYFHPRFENLVDQVEWPRSLRVGNWFFSPSPLIWGRFLRRLFKAAMSLVGSRGRIYSYLGDPLDPKEAVIVAKTCRNVSADISVAEYSSLGPLLDELQENTLKGVLLHDLFSDRCERFRRNDMDPDFMEITRNVEAQWVRAADFCVYASSNEMQEFSPQTPNAKALWLKPRPPEYAVRKSNKPPKVVFLGTRHAGNADALDHFIDKIWPIIVKKSPNTQLWVVGSIGRSLSVSRRQQQGVNVLGRLADLSKVGGSDAIGVAPTRLATGISIKVAEYLALGMPCVAYPLALEGFSDRLDDLVTFAETPAEFSAGVLNLLQDPAARRKCSENGLTGIKARLSNQEIVDYLRSYAAA